MTNLDKFGYYTVQQRRFYSKIQAFLYATEHKLPKESVKWTFNPDQYDTANWEIEPEESLDQLYDQRAAELRAQYDYVIISYSGGSDCHNVLMSFIRQGLHVDELVVHMFEKAIGGFSHLKKSDTSPVNVVHSEYVFHTLPMLKEISKKIPNTKITIVDQSDELENFFTSAKDETWVLNRTEFLGVLNCVKYNYLKDIRKLVDKTKNMVVILGTEKPRVVLKNDNYLYFNLSDKGVNSGKSVIDNLSVFDDFNIELFYWGSTSTCVKLLIKQSHVIGKWLTVFPKYQIFFVERNFSRTMFRSVHEKLLKRIIYYSTWNDDWWQCDKAAAEWHVESDLWHINNQKMTDGKSIWNAGLQYIEKHAAPFVYTTVLPNTTEAIADGIMGFTLIKKTAKVLISDQHAYRISEGPWFENPHFLKKLYLNVDKK